MSLLCLLLIEPSLYLMLCLQASSCISLVVLLFENSILFYVILSPMLQLVLHEFMLSDLLILDSNQ